MDGGEKRRRRRRKREFDETDGVTALYLPLGSYRIWLRRLTTQSPTSPSPLSLVCGLDIVECQLDVGEELVGWSFMTWYIAPCDGSGDLKMRSTVLRLMVLSRFLTRTEAFSRLRLPGSRRQRVDRGRPTKNAGEAWLGDHRDGLVPNRQARCKSGLHQNTTPSTCADDLTCGRCCTVAYCTGCRVRTLRLSTSLVVGPDMESMIWMLT